MILVFTRFLFILNLTFLFAPENSLAHSQSELLRDSIHAADKKEWEKVNFIKSTLTNEISRDVVDWLRLRGEQGSFEECFDFLKKNSDWPGLKLLRKRCEKNIGLSSDPVKIVEYFSSIKPQTGLGSLSLAKALISQNFKEEGVKELQRSWVLYDLTKEEHDLYVSNYLNELTQYHVVRLDAMLWNGYTSSAKRMSNLVNDGWKKLADARIALRENRSGVDQLIREVPSDLKKDPGMAFERFLWRLKNGKWDGAIEILLDRSSSANRLGIPEFWGDWRRVLAREMMRDGQTKKAYAIASSHFLTEGASFADLEWLSGYLALKKLDAPDLASIHFNRFDQLVRSPISIGRSGYWLGLTYKRLRNHKSSQLAFKKSAGALSSFYGQLSVQHIDEPKLIDMSGGENPNDWRLGRFSESSVLEAAKRVSAAGSTNLTERFLVQLSEKSSREEFIELAGFAMELGETHVALMISKQAAREGIVIFDSYFPVSLPDGVVFNNGDDAILPLSIIRRESEFDPEVISPAGARGLMQMMPKTGQKMAQIIGVHYSSKRLIVDPEYNVRLGVTYLEKLSDRFSGNIVLVATAYNAGPTRVDRWLELFGDPRDAGIDAVDWIESIPYRETRNYVMRIAESLLPYEARLNGKLVWKDLYSILKN